MAVGDDLPAAELLEEFDAVLLALGAGEPRDLPVPGRELDGIHFAMDFLVPANRLVAGEIDAGEVISAQDKAVLVIGGGDTGSDCVGTANRLGAKSVRQIEILPKPPEWTRAGQPELALLAEHPAHLQLAQGGLRARLVADGAKLLRPGRTCPRGRAGAGRVEAVCERRPGPARRGAGQRLQASRPIWCCWPWASSMSSTRSW